MNSKIEELNKTYKAEYEKQGGLDRFVKYVMSETISPIEDYPNIVNLIRANYHKQINGELLIIGAYLAIQWTEHYNELLDILNMMRPCFPDKEKAIVHYLNAYKLYVRDENYLSNPYYKMELRESIRYNIPFVNNRFQLAECSAKEDAQRLFGEALKNVQEIFSEEAIMKLPLEHFLEPQSFINEFILGICMTEDRHNDIKRKMEPMMSAPGITPGALIYVENYLINNVGFRIDYELIQNPNNESGIFNESWGKLKVFLNGKDICKYQFSNCTYGYEGNLYFVIEWLCENLEFIIGYDPFPVPVEGNTSSELISSSNKFESEDEIETYLWYSAVQSWSFRHSWIVNRGGSILPNVYFRRKKDDIEISLNNGFWKDSAIYFIEPDNEYLIPKNEFKKVILSFLFEIMDELKNKESCNNVADTNKLSEWTKRLNLLE